MAMKSVTSGCRGFFGLPSWPTFLPDRESRERVHVWIEFQLGVSLRSVKSARRIDGGSAVLGMGRIRFSSARAVTSKGQRFIINKYPPCFQVSKTGAAD